MWQNIKNLLFKKDGEVSRSATLFSFSSIITICATLVYLATYCYGLWRALSGHPFDIPASINHMGDILMGSSVGSTITTGANYVAKKIIDNKAKNGGGDIK